MIQQNEFQKIADYIETSVLETCTGVVQRINKTIKKLSHFITERTISLLSRAQRQNLRQNIKNNYGKMTKKWMPTFKRTLLQQLNGVFREKAYLRKQLYFSKIKRANEQKIQEFEKKQRYYIKLKAMRIRVDDYLEKKKTMKKKCQRFWKYAQFLKNKTSQMKNFVKDCQNGVFESQYDDLFRAQSIVHSKKLKNQMELVMQKFKSTLRI